MPRPMRTPRHAPWRLVAALALVIASALAPVPALASELGDDIAWLAVRVAATADPDPAVSILGAPASPTGAWYRLDDPRLANEYAVYDATLARQGGSTAYASCTQAVCAVLGCTMDLRSCTLAVSRNSQSFMAYIPTQPGLYREVTGCGMDGLEPGDILCNDWHTAIYVGNAAARERFPKTGGNVYEAHYFGGKYPAISTWGSTNGFRVFRPVARRQGDAFPDYEALVGERRHREPEPATQDATAHEETPAVPAAAQDVEASADGDDGGQDVPQHAAQGTLSVAVSSSDQGITSGNDAYSLGGATFDVFSDEGLETRVASLVTGDDGTSEAVTLDAGEYWVAMTGAPSGFSSDAVPRRTEVTADADATVGVPLPPVTADADGAVSLVDADTGGHVAQGEASLSGAAVTLVRDGSDQTVSGTTDHSGHVRCDSALPIGIWHVHVNQFPQGYVAGQDADATVTVATDGSVSATDVPCEAERHVLDASGASIRELAASALSGTAGGRLVVANVSAGPVVRDGVSYQPGTVVYDGTPTRLELPCGSYRVSMVASDAAMALDVGNRTVVVEVG